jgi:hypothetical protein
MDIPRIFTITESAHRIHNPITPEKLAVLGAALRLAPGAGCSISAAGRAKCCAPGRAITASPAPAWT